MEQEEILKKIKLTKKLSNFYELLETKNYELIYQYYGKDIYKFFAPKQYQKEDIKLLLEQKEYGKICNKYGVLKKFSIKDYRKNKKNDIKKLLEDGRYEEIRTKYGESEYNKYLAYMFSKDVYNATGSLSKMRLYRTKYTLKDNLSEILKYGAFTSMILLCFGTSMLPFSINDTHNNNEIEYVNELNQYNEKIGQYADEIRELNLTDLQIIMKVIDDKWNEIEGYGNPKKDIGGLWRLDFLEENGVGVCRNLADDFTAIMNEINPDYHARNLSVYVDFDYYTSDSFANIKIKKAQNFSSDESRENEEESDKLDITKIFGNHMVTLLDIPNTNITLVVDPTNPSIGVLNNGKIEMLSTNHGLGLKYMPMGELNVLPESYFDVNKSILKSILPNEASIEYLKEEYGIEAQNDALDYIRGLHKENSK